MTTDGGTVVYTPRDVAVERRRALVALIRAHIVELRYIERRHGLKPARFDGRFGLAPAEGALLSTPAGESARGG